MTKTAREGIGVACASRTNLCVRETAVTTTFIKAAMIAGLAGALAAISPAGAGETVAVGRLDCGINGGASFIFQSTRELRCVFRPRLGMEGELYEGQIKKYGLDIGITNNARLTWLVLAPTELPVNEGALMGQYVGVAADASLGVGGGANVLIGGSNDTISLQPLSVQGQTGLNAALAVAEVQLVPFHEDH